ncbi:MAG TPA: alpha/beta hydrolase [Bryobacteraceae bacterium]|nr:alpha/beta hydrolase [Bryobacteraceae bacterium]
MSAQELQSLVTMLRTGGPDLAAPLPQARENFENMFAAFPVAADVIFETATVGGVPARWATAPGVAKDRVLLYLHGGGYMLGSSLAYRALFSGLARAAGARGLALDYRLAPENPFPAAVDDAVAGYRGLLGQGIAAGNIAIAGDSAGGGLTVAMLVAARDAGLPMPAAAVAISPLADLACTGESLKTKAAEDPSLNSDGLGGMAATYLQGASPRSPLASPIYADLKGLPPLLIQVGSVEILLDDSVRLAARAGGANVDVKLDIWAGMPHVWHGFASMLSEGRDAIDQAGAFMSAQFQKRQALAQATS